MLLGVLGAGLALSVLPAASPDRGQPQSSRAAKPRKVYWSSGQPVYYAGGLKELISFADTIVVGKVTGIFRQDYTPIGHPECQMGGHSVFTVAVEQVLRDRGQIPLKKTIKVYQKSVVLPTEVWLDEGDVLLQVGRRYLLFLESPDVASWGKLGYVPANRGNVKGISAYLDEYLIPDWYHGKVLLDKGIASPPSDPWQTARIPNPNAWPGPTLYGRSEAELLADVRRILNTGQL